MQTVVALLLLAGTVQGSQADQDGGLKSMTLKQLGDIEVTTASKEPVKVSKTPAAIYVITQEDIRRAGATSIPEVLRLAPGVEVARIDAVKWSVGIRGFGSRSSRSVLVVIDGRNVYSPLNAGVFWEVQDTLIEDVDRIEIIRGPGATIWGPNAVNGVINIITKSAKETQGALVSAGGGNEQSFLNFRYGAGNGKNLNYRAYGKAFTRGPEFHPDHKNFDDWRMGQGGFRADWEPGSRDAVTVQGDLYKGAIGDSISVALTPTTLPVIVQQDDQVSGGNLLGRWRRVLGDGSDFQLQTYYDRTRRDTASFAEIRDTFDLDFLHHVALARRHELLWGGGARFSLGRIPTVVPTIVFSQPNRTDKLYSAFVQDEIQIAQDRLWLTIGSKFLHTDFSGLNAQPSARLLWTPGPRQTLWAAVTRAVRTPADVEVNFEANVPTSTNPFTILRLEGNRQFRPETLLGYEGGYRGLLSPKIYVDITAFDNRYDDLLSAEFGAPFLETSPPPHLVLPLLLGNGLYGSTSGFEIAPDWRPATWWRLDGSYSYLHMDLNKRPDSRDASSVLSTEGSNPHHKVVVRSWFSLPGRMEFSQTYRYVSALPAQHVGGYHTADVRLGWRAAEHLELSVAGQNLLQPHHPEFGGDPGALVGIKRSVYGAITWRSGKR